MVPPCQRFAQRLLLALIFLSDYVHRSTLPQSRIRSTAPSEREPGTAVPLIQPPKSRNVAGDFHRPYETQKPFPFTIHRTTLPQSRPFGRASSLREGAGNGCTTHPAAQKPQRCGRFSSPLRNAKDITLHHSSSHPGRRGRPGRNSGRTGGLRRSGSGDTRRTGLWWRPRRASGGRWAWWR